MRSRREGGKKREGRKEGRRTLYGAVHRTQQGRLSDGEAEAGDDDLALVAELFECEA